jgi:DNA-binding transcriptional LysR family regulator
MSITLDMLEAFVKVVDHLSISAAAAELDINKSLVSKRVGQLEEAIKATLLIRNSRKVALTPAGDIYVEFARNAVMSLKLASENLQNLRAAPAGLIRLTAPVSWGQKVLAKLLPAFLEQHSAIEIELILQDRLMDIAFEQIDLALRMTAAPALDLVSIPVARLDWVVCAAPRYLAQAGRPARPADLKDHPCMNYWRVNADDSWQFLCDEDTLTVQVHGRFRANNPESITEAALAGSGIALLPRYVCQEHIEAGQLTEILTQWRPVTKYGNAITAVAAPDRIGFSRNQALLGFLKLRLLTTPLDH